MMDILKLFCRIFVICLLALSCTAPILRAAEAPDFNRDVLPILNKYCNSCHNATDKEGGLILDSYDSLLKGGKRGAAVVPSQADASRLLRLLDGKTEPKMPPEGNDPPPAKDIATLAAWVNSGAKSPTGAAPDPTILLIPTIKPTAMVRRAATAIAFDAKSERLAVGRYATVEVVDHATRQVQQTLTGIRGQVNQVTFTADGKSIIAAAGEIGLVGEVAIWEISKPTKPVMMRGHRDAIYGMAYSADKQLLATGSYDQSIILWDLKQKKQQQTLSGHNGAVFGLEFARSGQLLASASADRTVKLWNTTNGERLETFPQPGLDQFAVTFAPDGQRLAAAGADNRIRIWQLSSSAKEGSNPILHARFAHEQPITKLLWSPDGSTLATAGEDRRIKLWKPDTVSEKLVLDQQPDQIGALAWSAKSDQLAVGRLDGSVALYTAVDGKEIVATPPPKPEFNSLEPKGIQSGHTTKVLVRGKHLQQLSAVKANKPGVTVKLLDEAASPQQHWIEVTANKDLVRGNIELQLQAGELMSEAKLNLWVEELPSLTRTLKDSTAEPVLIKLPTLVWGTFSEPGITEKLAFDGQAGDTVVLDLAHRRLGEKRNMVLQVLGPDGKQLSGESADEGDTDPLLMVKLPVTGRYTVRIQELELQPANWRLAIGDFGMVTGAMPLTVKAGSETPVELLGLNLRESNKSVAKAPNSGEANVPFANHLRSRGPIMIPVSADGPQSEVEPNNQPQRASQITIPGTVTGRFEIPGDVDWYRITLQQGQTVLIETTAARRNSPADTKLSVHTPDGQPVPRLLLQAVRDSYINFRPINSDIAGVRLKNWEEMELNDYIYYGGEVNRIFRAPQGPDSDSLMYVAENGKRRAYFDTTATSHANYDAAYVVEPHPPGTKLPNIGLPIFSLPYQNDDAGERDLRTDSRITFVAPQTGEYLIRVIDSRDAGSSRHVYQLTIREPKPDFNVTIGGMNPTVPAGVGREVNFTCQRIDGFSDEIQIEAQGDLPAGFQMPRQLTIQAGQRRTMTSLTASKDAVKPDEKKPEIKFVASAIINGQKITKPIGSLGKITLSPAPKLLIEFAPGADAGGSPDTIVLQPGRSVTAKLKLTRNGFKGAVSLDVLNLPHGVIVDNIGLNAVLILPNENERDIMITAANWVEELDRPIAAIARTEGGLTSTTLQLQVRKAKP